MGEFDAVRAIILKVREAQLNGPWNYYSNEVDAAIATCDDILEEINKIDVERRSEFVLFAGPKTSVYHRRRLPPEPEMRGSVTTYKTLCGRRVGLGSHRVHAQEKGLHPCGKCFPPGS